MLFTPHRHPMLLNPIEPQRWLTVLLALLFSFGAFGEDAAPPSPERPWSPPRLDKYERQLAQEGARERPDAAKVAINPKKVYDLPELIDLAERNNPDTRVAWESARKAAAAVGLSESAYYPYLMASAGAGYERAFIPFPTLAVDQRVIAQQIEQARVDPQGSFGSHPVEGDHDRTGDHVW